MDFKLNGDWQAYLYLFAVVDKILVKVFDIAHVQVAVQVAKIVLFRNDFIDVSGICVDYLHEQRQMFDCVCDVFFF